jgi:hypothetical protein
VIQPEPSEPSEVPRAGDYTEAVARAEESAVLKLQRGETLAEGRVKRSSENTFQRLAIELNRVVIVAPSLTRWLQAGIAANHVGHVPEDHG